MTGLLLFALVLLQTSAQSSAKTEYPPVVFDSFGYHLCALNDVDGDKCADFAVDDACAWVWVVSGATGRALASLHCNATPAIYSLHSDLDGDGVWDLLVVEHGNCTATIRSGKTLAAIRAVGTGIDQREFPSGAVTIADWDGDGVFDILAVDQNSRESGLVVLSTTTGKEVYRAPKIEGCILGQLACRSVGEPRSFQVAALKSRTIWSILHPEDRASVLLYGPHDGTGVQAIADLEHRLEYEACLFVPDLDGDGSDDLLLQQSDHCEIEAARAGARVDKPHKGAIGLFVYSSKSHKRLRELPLPQPLWSCCDGVRLARLCDLDGDGVDEIGVARECFFHGDASIYSGRSGERLRVHNPETKDGVCNLPDPGHFGVSIQALGDLDGDRVGDYAIGTSGGADGMGQGCVSLYSGKSGKLLRVIWKRDLVKEQK